VLMLLPQLAGRAELAALTPLELQPQEMGTSVEPSWLSPCGARTSTKSEHIGGGAQLRSLCEKRTGDNAAMAPDEAPGFGAAAPLATLAVVALLAATAKSPNCWQRHVSASSRCISFSGTSCVDGDLSA